MSCVFFHGLLALQRLDTNKNETNQANINEISAIMLMNQPHLVKNTIKKVQLSGHSKINKTNVLKTNGS